MEAAQHLLEATPLILFAIIGTIAVASSVLVVLMRNPVHSAMFLLVTFLAVAVLFIMQGAEFVGAVQILVYAGGIMVLFLFVVMLINVRHLADEKIFTVAAKGAVLVGLALFLLMIVVVRPGQYALAVDNPELLRSTPMEKRQRVIHADGSETRRTVVRNVEVGNSEAVGMALYQDYLVPFEVASLFLLVAMIGAIIIGKRELLGEAADIPDYMSSRVREEKKMKGAIHA